jgi:predicted amidohydrolase
MTPPRLTVATAQFAPTARPTRNAQEICTLLQRAVEEGADAVHFPEAALSGYAGAQIDSWEGYDWAALAAAHEQIAEACRESGVHAIYGSAHQSGGSALPSNAVFVVGASGTMIGRYDKRCCSKTDSRFFTSGSKPLVFDIGGLRCGVLICLEWSFPTLWQAYAESGVDLVFLSAFGAGLEGNHLHSDVIPPTLQGHAFTNCLYISVSNASNSRQAFASHWVKRSGRRGSTCRRHRRGFVINTIADDPEKDAFYALVRGFRRAATERLES